MASDAPPKSASDPSPDYVVVVGHSNLFYWWPVWAVGFLMALLTLLDGHRMAVVPEGTVVEKGRTVEGVDGPRDVLVAPANAALGGDADDAPAAPGLRVANTNNYGVIFVATLVITAVVSNITFRGLVSVIVLILLVLGVLGLALLDWWDDVFRLAGGLDVRMNAGGYLAVAVPLLAAWLFTTFAYDRQHYVVFDQGQIRYVRDIGDGETVMDVHGVVVEKKRDDMFRHWLFGLGSGDIKVRTGGSNAQTFEIENVLGVSRKLRLIHRMLQEREVSAVVAAPMGG